jgi:hypothetical protein
MAGSAALTAWLADPVADPWFSAIAVPTRLIAGISKGGFASGWANLAVPAMALMIPAYQAAGIVLPILCVMEIVGIWADRPDCDRRLMLILAPGALAGIVLGAFAFGALSDRAVKTLIGAAAVLFTLHASPQASPPRSRMREARYWRCTCCRGATRARCSGSSRSPSSPPRRCCRRPPPPACCWGCGCHAGYRKRCSAASSSRFCS